MAHGTNIQILAEQDETLKKFLSVFLKRWHMIAVLVIVCASLSLIYSVMQKPVFRSTSRILVEAGSSKMMKNEDVELSSFRDTLLYINSQIEILKSSFIARRVSDEIGSYKPWRMRINKSEISETLADKDQISEMLKKVSIKLMPRTQIIEISVEDIDPKLAERIANAWVYAYINYPMESNAAITQKANVGVEKAAQKAKQRLEEAQDNLNTYKKEHNISAADDEALSSQGEATLLSTLIKKKSELEVQLAQQLNYLRDRHPVIIGLRAELKSIDDEIKGQSGIRERTVQYMLLKRDVETSRALYESFMNRMLHTEAIEGLKSNIKIVDEAQVPKHPIRPKKLRNVLVAILGSLFGGLCLAYLLDALDMTIKSADDIKDVINLPFLGAVPLAEKLKNSKSINSGSHNPHIMLKNFENQFSPISESYRSLRTAITFSSADMKHKTLSVTSAGPQEGKSTTVTNLAIVMAQAGERVLLIDADFRRPTIHKFFGFKNEKGLTDIFMDDKENLYSNIRQTEIPNLDVLVCGSIPPNPSELLGSNKMEWVIGELVKIYDKVIFDTPPVLAATDAVVLSTKVEGTVIVTKANQTHKQAVQRTKEILLSAGTKIIGMVLNMVDTTKRHGYYDYYYYSYYGTYGKKKSTSDEKETVTSSSLHGSA